MYRNALKLNFVLFCLLIGLIGCSKSYTFSTDRDASARFDQYTTFQVIDYYKFKGSGDPVIDSELNKRRIASLIEAQMRQKGYVPAEEGRQPELYVKFRNSIEGRQEFVQNFNNNAWGWNRWNAWNNPWMWNQPSVTTFENNYEEVNLVIDIVDARNNNLLWQGWAFDRLKRNRKNYMSNMEKIIQAMFNEYPFPKK